MVGAIIRASEPSPLSPPGGVIAQSNGLAFEVNPYSLDTTQLNTNTRAYARAVFTVVRNACTAGPLDLFGRLVCFLESLEPEGVATFEVSSINAAIQGTDDSLPMDCRLNTTTPIP